MFSCKSSFVRGAVVGLALLLPVAPLAAQPKPGSGIRPTAESLFQQALELHQAGDILGAIAAYQASLNLNPDNPGAHSNLGAAFVRLGRYDEAIKEYRTAVEADPKNATFQFNLGLAYYKSAQVPPAAEAFATVLALQKDHLNARLLLGDCYLQMGRFQDTVDALALWEDSYGDSAAYAYILGSALVETDRMDQGQRLIDRIFSKGDSAEAHLLMATVHLRRTDNPAALEELQKAAALNPKLPLVHSLMGRALLRTGDQAGAAKAFATELTINPNDFQANLEIGDLQKARTALRRGRALHPARAAHAAPGSDRSILARGSARVARRDGAGPRRPRGDRRRLGDLHGGLRAAGHRLLPPAAARRRRPDAGGDRTTQRRGAGQAAGSQGRGCGESRGSAAVAPVPPSSGVPPR